MDMNRAYTAANPATRLDNLGSAPDSCAIEYMSSDSGPTQLEFTISIVAP